MATLVADEFFSDGYMDAFYKAHVASSRNRGTLDDDIAAIEAEIRKIHQYRSKFQSFRFDQNLNSCGNSECSDEDDFEDSSPTSVFKVYNSSTVEGSNGDSSYSHPNHHKIPDVFTWAASQQVQHDHGYCKEPSSPHSPRQATTCIDHGTVSMTDILWHQLSPSKRAQAVEKLSCILQQKPSGRQSPTFSSLDLLPTPLANWIRRTGPLDLTSPPPPPPPPSSSSRGTSVIPTTRINNYNKSLHSTKNNFEKLGNRDIKLSRSNHTATTTTTSHQHPVVTARPITRHTTIKKKPSPYGTRQINIEVTRVRNISSCSEGEDPLVID